MECGRQQHGSCDTCMGRWRGLVAGRWRWVRTGARVQHAGACRALALQHARASWRFDQMLTFSLKLIASSQTHGLLGFG